ncbi:MAG: hypothetical protein V1676_01040 [Candidatus Diapherotrites archaeon]
MSRMVLAAMKKHTTPSEFVKKFLLPSIRRGGIPARSKEYWGKFREAYGHPELKLPKGNLTNITFYDIKNPKRLCYFSLQHTALKNSKATPPNVQVFHGLFVKIGDKDWQQGKEIAGATNAQHPGKVGSISEYIPLSHESLKRWRPVMRVQGGGKFKDRVFVQYGVSHELFNELQKYDRAGEDFNRLRHAFDFLSGKSTTERFARQLRLDHGSEMPYKDFTKILGEYGRKRLANILQEGLRITPHGWLDEKKKSEIFKEISKKTAEEFEVDKQFVEKKLAQNVVYACANNRKIVEGVLRDLREFPNVRSVPVRGNQGGR